MITRTIVKNQSFDPIAFEQERARIFEQTEKSFSSQKYSNYSPDFSDGEWDAKLGYEPSLEKWASANYKRGYLAGIEEKYDDLFAQLI